MATIKVTVTLEEKQLEAVRALVASGKAHSVSSFVKHAVDVSLSDVTGWGAVLGLALAQTGGPLTSRERAWADAILTGRSRPKRRRTAA